MAANTAVSFPKVDKGATIGSCSAADVVRTSVARTRRAFGGTAVPVSTVTSVTQDLVVAYPGTECNIPAIP